MGQEILMKYLFPNPAAAPLFKNLHTLPWLRCKMTAKRTKDRSLLIYLAKDGLDPSASVSWPFSINYRLKSEELVIF